MSPLQGVSNDVMSVTDNTADVPLSREGTDDLNKRNVEGQRDERKK